MSVQSASNARRGTTTHFAESGYSSITAVSVVPGCSTLAPRPAVFVVQNAMLRAHRGHAVARQRNDACPRKLRRASRVARRSRASTNVPSWRRATSPRARMIANLI